MILDGYQTDAYLKKLTQTSESNSETINAPKMTGWICPVCGRGLSPYTCLPMQGMGSDVLREETEMTEIEFRKLCFDAIKSYFKQHNDTTNLIKEITDDQIFIVWQVKALQNFKALASTTLPDGMYYEITYNGDKDELYFDVYKKWENVCFTGIHAVDPLKQ